MAVGAIDIRARVPEGHWHESDGHLRGTNLLKWHT